MTLFTWACFSLAMSSRRMSELRSVFVRLIVSQRFWSLSLAGLFIVIIQGQVFYSDSMLRALMWVICKGVYECAAIVLLINIGCKRWNVDSGALRYLSRASFPIYILHFLPVTFFSLILIRTTLPDFLKFALTVLFSYATVFILYECWRRIRIFLIAKRITTHLKTQTYKTRPLF